MHIHILGICGTFMGGIAQLAKSAGHHVTGADANVYPPMSTQLESSGISLTQGFDPAQLDPVPDMIVVGNIMTRGKEIIEYILNNNLPYTSGPQWLAEHILKDKWVLGVSGTHGKTSTSSMLAWILEYANMSPGFLIGGVPENFSVSARLGETPFFVVEADEYDTAFFDKRSKFVHYRPRTLIINNLEYDHADIFPDLASIQRQFHHLIRCVPGDGVIIAQGQNKDIDNVIEQGCWTPVQRVDLHESSQTGWRVNNKAADGSAFNVVFEQQDYGRLSWELMGDHNVSNALGAIAAARHVGVTPQVAIEALVKFKNVKRRMEVKGQVDGITVYDDFAHHPTAIATTVQGLRNRVSTGRVIAVLEPRSNSMRMGAHKDGVLPALEQADRCYLLLPSGLDWQLPDEPVATPASTQAATQVFHTTAELLESLVQELRSDDHVLIMSNGSFDGIHDKLLSQLENRRKKDDAAT